VLEVVAAAAADVLDDDPPAAAALDDVDDDDDPHPPRTAAMMATSTAPAPLRARLELNMGATPPLGQLARVPVRVEPSPAWRSKPV
jgi:hypothetical protein